MDRGQQENTTEDRTCADSIFLRAGICHTCVCGDDELREVGHVRWTGNAPLPPIRLAEAFTGLIGKVRFILM